MWCTCMWAHMHVRYQGGSEEPRACVTFHHSARGCSKILEHYLRAAMPSLGVQTAWPHTPPPLITVSHMHHRFT